MKKILHVISGLGMGGAETMLVRLTASLRERGFSQHVVCVNERGAKADDIEAIGVPVTLLNLQSLNFKSPVAVPVAAYNLRKLIVRFQPDVVQGWMYHGDLLAAVGHALAPRRESRKLIWNIRASNMNEGGYGGLVWLSAKLSAWPDVILANSRAGLDFHQAQGYRPRRSEIIPNGIEEARYRPDPDARKDVRSQFGIASDAVVAIHVARVDPMKDHATFLKAMELTPQIAGFVVGKGTEALSRPPNVKALGVRNDVERLYAAADIVVSTSIFGEGFSNAIAEGMSAGLVPVATDIGDARLIVGDTGAIIPSRNGAALAKTLATLASLPASELRARGLNARARIKDNFSMPRAADRFAQLYSEA